MAHLSIGDFAPWFSTPTIRGDPFSLDLLGGQQVLLCCLPSPANPSNDTILEYFLDHNADTFDGVRNSFVGIVNPDETPRKLHECDSLPGIVLLPDESTAIRNLYGVGNEKSPNHPTIFLLNPRLQVVAVFFLAEDLESQLHRILTPLESQRVSKQPAPILVIERVFELGLCKALIEYYTEIGGRPTGFVGIRDGQVQEILDTKVKRRRDVVIEEPTLREAVVSRVQRRIVPEVQKAFQFNADRIERHVVVGYDAEEGGFFRPHRDNASPATAHRRFAVSVNLNAGDYEGGDLRFPEFGPTTYRPPRGGAVVFSCSLLHEATTVTSGVRYAYLPFLYHSKEVG